MGRRKKHKKKSKNTFPNHLNIAFNRSSFTNFIVTDAGFDKIDSELAAEYFSLDDIFSHWEYFMYADEIDEEELEAFDRIISSSYSCYDTQKSLEVLQGLVSQFEWLPRQLDIVTARAVFDLEHQWVQVITLIDRWEGEICFDSYEAEAIRLGLRLKQELGDENLAIVNDNQYAVAELNQINSSFWRFMPDFFALEAEQIAPQVFWSPRKFLKSADRLTIEHATKVFHPEHLWEDDF
jgi:hypothetical protein